jgi:hypothetical protein
MILNRENIINLLNTNDKAIARALIVLTERQTFDEMQAKDTKYQNGIGFTPADARMGVSMGLQARNGFTLSAKQLAYWRKPNAKGIPRIGKYANQLIDAAKQKITENS